MAGADAKMQRTPGYGDQWFVSWRNLEAAPDGGEAYRIHDVTLRDGEQQAGVLFSHDDKIAIAEALAELGVDRIEGGMVAVSEEDRRTLKQLVERDLGPEIWGVVRSRPEDIEQAIDIGVDGVGIILLANDQYCRVFGWTAEAALESALRTADRGAAAGLQTTLLIADSSRMTEQRLAGILSAASSSGVLGAVALMDTFGALSPRGTAHLVRSVRAMTSLAIEFHAHNDFGLGTANVLASLEAGADIVHASMLGLGERVGNAPLEEVALAASLLCGRSPRMNLGKLRQVAELVARRSGVAIAANKPVVGPSYARIESGSVVREYMRLAEEKEDVQWLFPFDPALIGRRDIEIVLGKGSGVANIELRLAACGLCLDGQGRKRLLEAVKERAISRHRALDQEEFERLARDLGASRLAGPDVSCGAWSG